MTVVERAVAGAELNEDGGRVEPSKLRKEWAGTFPLPTEMTWRLPESGSGEG